MPADEESLRAAWRALAGELPEDGWRTIPFDVAAPCRVLVGRRHPGGEEAVLAGFRLSVTRPGHALPSGRGFLVERPVGQRLDGARHWVALSRQPSGSLDLFAMMAADVLALFNASTSTDDNRLFQLFVGRIRAWQEFMEKGRDGVLAPEAEIGLFGELVVLAGLLDAGLSAWTAVECWQGPLDALQDFLIGPGAIEVKATIAAAGFPATIGSLEQLDDSVRQPLYLAGVRLSVDGSGQSLRDLVAAVRSRLRDDIGTTAILDSRLLQVGYFDAFSDRYTRRFIHVGTRILAVDQNFPRLTRAAVPAAISRARYEIDLDLVAMNGVDLRAALTNLGEM